MRALPLLVLLAATAAAQPTRVPGSRAVLTPPPGYAAADAFAGFQNDDLGAFLMVTEMADAPLDEMIAGMTPQALAGQGVRMDASEDVVVNGVASRLVRGTQSANGETYTKWILVTGDDAGLFLVTGIIPRELSRDDGPALVDAMRSLTWGDDAPTNLFEGLGFTLDVPADLPDHRRLGASLLLADGIGPDRGGAPVFIAALGSESLEGSLASVTEARLRQTATLEGLGPVQGRPLEVDGRRGYEVVAQGRDGSGPVTAYLVLVPADVGYVVFQGIVGADRADEWVPRFRDVTRSVRWAP